MSSAEDLATLEALAGQTVWGSVEALCAPVDPPPSPTGSGPVRESVHADAVFALRQLETAAAMMRQHLEDRPRDDFMLDLHADLVVEALVVAGAHITRFRDLREPAEIVDLAAARIGREMSELLSRDLAEG